MKKQICIMAMWAVAAVGLAGGAEAKGLEEILKEKGVITAEEYQEAMKQKPAAYVAGKGFTAATADGDYTLKIGGYAQLLYKYTDFDAQTKDDTSDFNIRRFKLQLKGNVVSKKLGFKFQGDLKKNFVTEDAFITYKFGAPLTLKLGQFKPAQARQELTSAAKQLFPERSLANDTFNLGRDQGLQAAGSLADKLVEYRLGVFNGNSNSKANLDNRHMIAGRIDLNPLGAYKMDEAGWPADKLLLNVGGSFARNKIGAADVGSGFNKDNDVMDKALNLDALEGDDFTASFGRDLTWLLWTANVNATWQGASFAAEYYDLGADPDRGEEWDADGYYVQAGYQVIPKTLELGVRYSEIESEDAGATAVFDKAETQIGVNYYFAKHKAKLQTDYTMVDDDRKQAGNDDIFRLQMQFYY